ncbi:MAG: hypothetical protein ABIQ64_03605 [Candidatus Saccharimonadales bacterium]
MKRLLRALVISLALVTSSFASIVPLATTPVSAATVTDCSDNAVVNCGVHTVNELQSSYKGDVKAVYNHMGITDGMVSGTANIKEGVVTKSGDVLVGGKVIATDAISVGRTNKPGSTAFTAGGTTFYQRSTSSTFTSSQLDAYVMVDNTGKFLGAVIKSCGNPVKATPVVVKVPAAACTAVTAHKLTRTTYRFTGTATVKDGATISAYVFAVKGPSATNSYTVASTTTTATTPTVTVTAAGTYTVTLTVKTSLGDKTGANCATTFTVEKEKTPETPAPVKTVVCNPATGQTITVEEKDAKNYKPVGDVACQPKVESAKTEKVEVIASTGPGEILGGVAGLGSLTAAGYYLRASRQRLINTLKK